MPRPVPDRGMQAMSSERCLVTGKRYRLLDVNHAHAHKCDSQPILIYRLTRSNRRPAWTAPR